MKLFQFNTKTHTNTRPKIASPESLTNEFYSLFPETLRNALNVKETEFVPTALKAKFDATLDKYTPKNVNPKSGYTNESIYKNFKQELENLIPENIRNNEENSRLIDQFAKDYTNNFIQRRSTKFYGTKEALKKVGATTAVLTGAGLAAYGGYKLLGNFGKKKKDKKEEDE